MIINQYNNIHAINFINILTKTETNFLLSIKKIIY